MQIGFESQEAMAEALSTDAYKKAHELREQYMRETSFGVHSARLDETVALMCDRTAAGLPRPVRAPPVRRWTSRCGW
ncbi:hypothetical protein BX285_2705 [Streptomyces sp. 1114.5]|uniref:hypothetical protein n=1 Tax=Streptomyces sp. 1114.5 TaxID=1938830 RepID=UPI000EAFF70D|nr:hypothetical protein [Streptomyces sp. 1114.5]RKT18285.1 hypothetical protein BX285_2705 [Streptomyces sp. 1114.5]